MENSMNQSGTPGIDSDFIVINCASNSTLQDLKINESSGVFNYHDSDDFNSVTSNRYIVWRTCDDVLELTEHSLNKNLIQNELKIQFKNSLILQNSVSVHETPDKIYILVITLVSAHRLVFTHPNKLFSNPNSISSFSCLGPTSSNSATNMSSSSDLFGYSIFHQSARDDFGTNGNYVPLPNSTSSSTILGPNSSFPFLATCSWVNVHQEAYFVVSNTTGSLHIMKLPSLSAIADNHSNEAKTQTFDLKQNTLIGKFFNGFVPSIMKSSSGTEAAIALQAFSTNDDDLIFALCRDLHIRVLSLKHQGCVIVQNLFPQFSGKDSAAGSMGNHSVFQRKPISMKFWWHDNDTMLLPNLVVYVSAMKHKSFYFYETILPNQQSQMNLSNSFNASQSISKQTTEPKLRFLLEVFAPNDCDLLDYFVSDDQLWVLWQQNESVHLHYYSVSSNPNCLQPLEWIPVVADVNAQPEMAVYSSLVNSREHYLNEIFWRGNFSLATISKAISVQNRMGVSSLANAKIDTLLQEAIKLVDNLIRNQVENQMELTAEEYTELELNAWHQLYLFCLEYHVNENKPMSIFVDYNTGVKGIVRKARIQFIPSLSPVDNLINQYFILCKQNSLHSEQSNGNVVSTQSNSMNLFSISAMEYRLNTLMEPIDASINNIFSSSLENSILALLHGMAVINAGLKEEDLLNFEAFMHRMSSCSSKAKLSLVDIAKKITEDSLLPDMASLTDNSVEPLIDDFFEKCPLVAEAINFLLHHISFDFNLNSNEVVENLGLNSDSQLSSINSVDEELQLKMQEGLQYEIKPMYYNLLSSRCGLEFVVTSIGNVVQMRYKFCRDLFLFQYMLSKFRLNLKSDYMPKILPIESVLIPQTAQLLFALDYLSWASETPMITGNLWWTMADTADDNSSYKGITSIVNLAASPSGTTGNTLKSSSSIENSELLSVLEMREYITLNRVGILSHESTFYEAYPKSTILHFFIQFSGGILAKRLLSYQLAFHARCDSLDDNIWSSLMPKYLSSICQLLWPFSAGQFKLAEFLVGVAQYDLLERYIQRLHTWCMNYSYSRFFLKGICSLVSGEGEKAIRQFKQALFGINHDPFLYRIFAQKAPMRILVNDDGDNDDSNDAGEEDDDSSYPEQVRKTLAAIKSSESDLTSLPNARTIFRYYNKLIQLFKRYSSPDHVIELVEVALNTLDKNSDPEYDEHYSSLHSTLFACHLRLGNIVQAYEAMVNNTDVDQRKICLRQFILNLCESGELSKLVSFPYTGLEDDFVAILESKARATSTVGLDVTSKNASSLYISSASPFVSKVRNSAETIPTAKQINYYHILYTYFIGVNNYRRAAQAIYDYYRRLSLETAGSGCVEYLQKQADALLIARNCLKIVNPTYSWIIKNTIKRTTDNGEFEDLNSSCKNRLKRKHGYFQTGKQDDQCYQQDKTIIDIVDEEELLCEYELVSARLRLLQRNAKEYAIASTQLTPEETVILCIGASLYEQAFRISTMFNLSLEPIFDGMASKYVQLLHGAYNRRRIDDELLLSMVSVANGASPDHYEQKAVLKPGLDDASFSIDLFDIFYENGSNTTKGGFISYSSLSICDRMWHLIMHYLSIYERQPKVSSVLIRQVAEKLLSNGIMIPTSLLKVYQKANCAEVIRLLMTYNFLPEATQLCIDYMNAYMGHGVEYFDLTHHLYANCPSLYVPLHIFDCLAKILREEGEQNKLELESWKGKIANRADTDYNNEDDGVDGSGDLFDDDIDFDELYTNLNKVRQKLQQTIVSCSGS